MNDSPSDLTRPIILGGGLFSSGGGVPTKKGYNGILPNYNNRYQIEYRVPTGYTEYHHHEITRIMRL